MKNIVLLFLLIPSFLVGQGIDMDRMNRDLKVAENGLKTLIKGESQTNVGWASDHNNFFRLSNRNVEGQYIPNYGVIFTAEICEPCFTNKLKDKEKKEFSVSNHVISAAETFLADYGSIIGQLRDDHKIMIRFTDEGGNNFPRSLIVTDGNGDQTAAWVTESQSASRLLYGKVAKGQNSKENSQEITVEAVVADLQSHMAGNLSRENLLAKFKTESKTISFEADPQLETFTAMLNRLYQKDLSSTYFMSSIPSYSKISDVGIMIKARVYSSNSLNNDLHSIPTIGKTDLTLEDRNAIVQDMLPEFEKVFKENIVSYARTIRSLKKGGSIMFEVRMTECKGCSDFPRYINFTISQDTLEQFNKGKLSFEQAVGKVSVERRGA